MIELARYGEKPVPELDAIRLANRTGLRTYVESSALTQRNLKEVFDEAIVAGLSCCEEWRRLTTASSSGRFGRTGNRLLNSIRENWRFSTGSGSERGLLRYSSRRSKTADTSCSNSSNHSNSSSGVGVGGGGGGGKASTPASPSARRRKISLWKRVFCCYCGCPSA